MNKITKTMLESSSDILQKRAEMVATNLEIEQTNLINTLKQEKMKLEMKIQDLTDFAPDSTDSLRPASKNFNAKQWVKELNEAKMELYEIKICLELAEETYNDYFKEEKNVKK